MGMVDVNLNDCVEDDSPLPDSVCGVTLADAEDYGRLLEENEFRVHSAPVRDVEKQSYWDFMLERIPDEDKFFTPDVMEAFRWLPI